MAGPLELNRIHKALMSFKKRAERSTTEELVASFVDSEALFDLLSNINNQVIYGRRGWKNPRVKVSRGT